MKRRVAIVALLLVGLGALLLVLVTLGGGADEASDSDDEPDSEPGTQHAEPPAPDPIGAVPPPVADLVPVELSPAAVHIDPNLPGGAFEGVVVNWATSEPVPNAELTFSRDGATVSVRSDETGRFRLISRTPGRYRLAVASAPGFLPYAPELGRSPIELVGRRHQRVSGILVYLSPAIDYTGVVLDAAGEPVTGAAIARVGAGGTDALIPMKTTFVSGADGTFRFHAFDGAVFEASHPTAGFGRGVLGAAAQISHRMEIRLSTDREGPSETIRGVVVGEGGAPIAGALVRSSIGFGGLRSGAALIHEATTSDDGRFELVGLDAREQELTAEADGYARHNTRATPGGDPVRITLAAGAVIRGEVVNAGGGPVASFTVIASRVVGPLQRGPGRSASVFDGDGGFEITGLDTQIYAIVATGAGHAPSVEVEVKAAAPDDAEPIVVTLREGGTLTGVVIDADSRAPLESARVSSESRLGVGATATPAIASAVTGADGRFSLSGLPPGKRSVNVAAFAHHAKIVTGLELVAGGELGPIEITLAPAREGEAPKTEFAGIGCAIGSGDDGFVVRRVFPESGCAEAGLAVGDVILAVEGRAVVELGFETALQQLRGPEGTSVQVSVRREAESVRVVTITRKKIAL